MDDAFGVTQRRVGIPSGRWITSGRIVRLVRFGITGVISNGLLLALFVALTASGMGAISASVAVYMVGMVSTYFVNRSWSFASARKHREAGIGYAATQLFGLALLLGMQWLLHVRLGIPAVVVQAIAIPCVAGASFILLEWFVFSHATARHK